MSVHMDTAFAGPGRRVATRTFTTAEANALISAFGIARQVYLAGGHDEAVALLDGIVRDGWTEGSPA